MPFIPDSTFGIVYMLLCFATVAIATRRNNTHARIVSLVMLAHWFSMRIVSWYDYNNPWLWCVHSLFWAWALGSFGNVTKSNLAFACSALVGVCMLFDQFWLFQHLTEIRFKWFNGGFHENAAVAEVIGYLCFLMIAGVSLGSSGGDTSSDSNGPVSVPAFMASGGAISRRSKVSRNSMATNQDH